MESKVTRDKPQASKNNDTQSTVNMQEQSEQSVAPSLKWQTVLAMTKEYIERDIKFHS